MKQTDRSITSLAQQATNLASLVIVVEREGVSATELHAWIWLLADIAEPVSIFDHLNVLVQRQTETSELCAHAACDFSFAKIWVLASCAFAVTRHAPLCFWFSISCLILFTCAIDAVRRSRLVGEFLFQATLALLRDGFRHDQTLLVEADTRFPRLSAFV